MRFITRGRDKTCHLQTLFSQLGTGSLLIQRGLCLAEAILCLVSFSSFSRGHAHCLQAISFRLVPCHGVLFNNYSSSFVLAAGGGFTRGYGEALQAADIPSEPPLSVETPGHGEEEATGLVSKSGMAGDHPSGHSSRLEPVKNTRGSIYVERGIQDILK